MSFIAAREMNHPATRLAHPSDLRRLATVGVASFAVEDLFSWLHPQFRNNIQAHIHSDFDDLKDAMVEDQNIMTVIEGPFEASESNAVDSEISYDSAAQSNVSQAGTPVIVGFAVWTWYPEASRALIKKNTPGQLATKEDFNKIIKLYSSPSSSTSHANAYSAKIKPLYYEHLEDCEVILQKLAVHPAYQRRGLGSALIQFGIRYAEISDLRIAVDATGNGPALYQSLGVQKVVSWRLAGDEESPRGLSGEMMVWKRRVPDIGKSVD